MAAFEISNRSGDLVAAFVVDLTWTDLPTRTQQAARACLLDGLGAMLVGIAAPVSWVTADYAVDTWKGSGATVFAGKRHASAPGAAFANATAANGTDIDDCGIYTWGHPGAQIVPAALAVAEELRCSGKELLEALVVGYEVAFRSARCMHDFHEMYRSCGSWGSVACAAVASRLMGLPREAVRQSLGIADYFSPSLPMMRDIDHPAMVKHGIGIGALNGIMSAQLAQRGFTGTPALIESKQYEGWIGDLGERYLIDGGVTAKEYSCCAWAHPALAAVKKLRELHEIPLEGIARIDVQTFAEACRLHVRLPETTEEAQFSLPWTVAVMLVDGEVGPEQVLGDRLGDPLVRRLASKVVAHARQDLTALHALSEDFDPAGKDLTSVSIELLDGTILESGLVELPLRPLTLPQVERKLFRITRAVMGRAECDHLSHLVGGLEAAPDVSGLVAALLAATSMNTGSGWLVPLTEQRR